MTPLVPLQPGRTTHREVLGKLDFVMPTLSFKDRGAAVLMSAAAAVGVRHVVADSSGNAGASIAAYAARAGIDAEVFVPEAAPVGKLGSIRRFGATLRKVPGDRAAAAAAAIERVAETGWMYASHAWQPLFTQGTKTVAFEIWEQLGHRAPETVVVPVGNGTLLLGAALGFSELQAAGLADRLPRLVGVQAERCAPLIGREPCGSTVAGGIAVAEPPRRKQILEAVSRTGGTLIAATEEAIEPARQQLAVAGIDVELTAAATWAAWAAWPGARAGQDEGQVVVVLTGAGSKGG